MLTESPAPLRSPLMTSNPIAALVDRYPVFTVLLAQAADNSNSATADPLIAQGSENTIYFGAALLAVLVISIIGIISGRTKMAILFGLFLAGILMVMLVAA